MPSAAGRALGIDLGSKRIGVAVCDAGRTVATPVTTVHRSGDRAVEHAEIGDLVAEYEAVIVVVGLPLSLDGTLGPAGTSVLNEVKALRRRLEVEVVTHDERFSTVAAQDSLRASGVDARAGRNVVDQVAASVILQAWIDAT